MNEILLILNYNKNRDLKNTKRRTLLTNHKLFVLLQEFHYLNGYNYINNNYYLKSALEYLINVCNN